VKCISISTILSIIIANRSLCGGESHPAQSGKTLGSNNGSVQVQYRSMEMAREMSAKIIGINMGKAFTKENSQRCRHIISPLWFTLWFITLKHGLCL
jgi:hypothetical protein